MENTSSSSITGIEVSFTLCDDPLPQPRPKARRIGKGIQIYTPQNARVKSYKQAVSAAFEEALGHKEVDLEAPIELRVDFFIKRPSNMCGKIYPDESFPHVKRPDLDNLVKTIMDGLNGIAWSDDSNVVRLVARKFYTKIVLGGKSGRKRESVSPFIKVKVIYNPDNPF